MLPILMTVLASVTAGPAVADLPHQDPAIRIWLNKGDYVERTEKVRAYVRTGLDGYVVILHAEPSGRVRVLFPLDPEDDAFVRAGQDYEIRSRSDKEAFRIYDGHGTGVIVAAISRDPFRFDGLILNRHWDYRAAAFGVGNDAEADLLTVVQQMTGGMWFDYDVVRYEVVDRYYAGAGEAYHLSLYGPYYGGHYWSGGIGFTVGFGWGWGWYDPWSWYDPWYGWGPCCGYGWYNPWPYRYAYYPYYPYYPSYPYYPGWGGYPPGYGAPGGPTYARHYYAAGSYATGYYYSQSGAWGSYAFKSYNDRYGLNPATITARRRTVGTGGTYAASYGSPASDAGRRTRAVSTPVGGSTPRSGTGSLEARRPAGTAAGTTVLPTINGRRPVGTGGDASAPQGEQPATTSGRRLVPPTGSPSTGDVQRRTVTPSAPSSAPEASGARRTIDTKPGGGIREIIPRKVTEPIPSAGSSRSGTPAAGTVGSGSTSRPSSGTLERRTPSRTATPARTPTRTVSPPTRSAPSARPAPTRSAPRTAPSRPTTGRSSPPARTSKPPSTPPRRRN